MRKTQEVTQKMDEQILRRSVQKGQWIGSTHCDFCRIDLHFVPYFFDACTRYEGGAWAVMCMYCFATHGCGRIGVGYGQKYDGQTFTKIGG